MNILCINSGSSSIKFAIYNASLILKGEIEKIGLPGGKLWALDADGKQILSLEEEFENHEVALKKLFSLELPSLDAASHRIVHGGPDLIYPTKITADVIQKLKELIPFAPLHLPSEILAIETIRRHYPKLPQVACFDTYFHRDLPIVARQMPLNNELFAKGVRKYGFHGLSYEYILSKVDPNQKIIIAHLGNGVSLCAVKEGKSVETTMGFTPAGGCMMGTRCGDMDPGVILYLQNELQYTPEKISNLINHQSGLLGISELTSDMQTLLARRKEAPKAELAINLFTYHVRKQIGALAAVLGGVDLLVFTGGIGENSSIIRNEICQNLEYLGINKVQVIQTNEDIMLVRHTKEVLS